MQTPQHYQPRLVLAGLALGVLLALLIWPATRWLVRSQLALSLPVPASVAPWSIGADQRLSAAWEVAQQRYQETAASHPDDFLLQFAAAVVVAPADEHVNASFKLLHLHELTQRFPNRPTLYAALLRFATQKQVRVDREEEGWLTGDPAPHSKRAAREPYNTPEQLAAFDREAAEGERLDPDNAYFPFMRSVGLFAAHRDAEALAALQRAAQKPRWIEYCSDELDGEWKLHEETFGTVGALPRMAYAAAILFPHYRELRAASRVAIAKAAQAEQAGRVAEGLAIRDTVRQCAGLIRTQSSTAIGAMIGISINYVSMARPGGAPPLLDTSHVMPERLREQRIRDYEAYVQRIGHAEEIAAVEAETAAGNQAREIVKSSARAAFIDAPWRLATFWIAAIVLLSNALWLLALGGGAALLARHRLIRTGQGLPPAARLEAMLGLFAGVLLAGTGILQKAWLASTLFLAGLLLSSLLVLALADAKGSDWQRKMGAFGLCLVGAALFCSAFAWQLDGSLQPIVQMMWGSGAEGAAPIAPRIYLLSVGIALLIPLLTLLTFSILSLIFRVPLSVGVARGLRGCALPIACLLLLAYGILVPMILRQETALDEGLKRMVQHEGRFIAETAGKQWPGAAR